MFLVMKACFMQMLFLFFVCWIFFALLAFMCACVCYQNVLCSALLHYLPEIVLNDSSRLVAKAASVEEVGPSTTKKADMLLFQKKTWLRSPDWKSGPHNSRLKLKNEHWSCFFAERIAQRDGHAGVWHYGVTEDLKAPCCTLSLFSFINHDLILSVMP